MIEHVFERVAGSACHYSHTPNGPRGGESEQQMHDRVHPGFTVIDVEGLGQPAMIVRTTGPLLLLLDTGLTRDQRIKILADLLPPAVA